MGDRWTDDMVDELFNCSPIAAGQFKYVDFVRAIKHGTRPRDADDDQVTAAAADHAGGAGVASGTASDTPIAPPNSDLVVHV